MKSISPPTFRKRKLSFYIIFSIYVFLSALILIESAIPAAQSGGHSNWIGEIIANVVNWITPVVKAEIVEPLGVYVQDDASQLGERKVALGTTTVLQFGLEEASLSKGQSTSRQFRYEKLGNHGDAYSVSLSSSGNSPIARISSTGEAVEDCRIRFYAGTTDDVYCDYSFDIVELPAPEDGEYVVALDGYDERAGYTLSINESVRLDVTLTGSHSDAYLRRYYDPSKLEAKSNDEAVATIDKNGIILGKQAGSAVISYGSYSFNIKVLSSEMTLGNELSVTSTGSISQNDYDILESYADSHEVSTMEAAKAISSGIILSASDGLADSGATYSWGVVDENGNPDYLGGKIVPLDANATSARLLGYRKGSGEKTYVKCTLNKALGENLVSDNEFEIVEILPASMTLFGGGASLSEGHAIGSTIELPSLTYYTGKSATFNATFLGEGDNANVTNRNLLVSEYDESALTIAGNGTSTINITFMEKGTYTVKISSAANSELFYILSIPVEQTPNVDSSSSSFQLFIRKAIGHLALFGFTSIFGMLFFALWWGKDNNPLLALGCTTFSGFLLAGFSELIQYFTPGRGPSWNDVGIDFLGYIIGTIIVFLIILLVRFIKKKKAEKSTQQIEEKDDQG